MTRRIAVALMLALILAASSMTLADAGSHKDPRTVLPQTPSRSDVVAAMSSVSDAIGRCGGGWHGVVQMRIVFERTGRATSVTATSVTAPSAPAAVAACVEQAARAAQVPPFRTASFRISYPFRF